MSPVAQRSVVAQVGFRVSRAEMVSHATHATVLNAEDTQAGVALSQLVAGYGEELPDRIDWIKSIRLVWVLQQILDKVESGGVVEPQVMDELTG